MAEYAKVGLETARVEDIVAAAGVSWGTFFHYFPAKEDVLLDAGAEVCRAYATAVQDGLDAGRDTESVLADAFGELYRAAAEVTPSNTLRGKLMLYVLGHPGRLTEFLGEEVAPPVVATTAALAEGQLRGEVRADEPAESLAVILLYSVLFSARRGATIGRPHGSTPLGRLALKIALRGMDPHATPLAPAITAAPVPLSSPPSGVGGAPGTQEGTQEDTHAAGAPPQTDLAPS